MQFTRLNIAGGGTNALYYRKLLLVRIVLFLTKIPMQSRIIDIIYQVPQNSAPIQVPNPVLYLRFNLFHRTVLPSGIRLKPPLGMIPAPAKWPHR